MKVHRELHAEGWGRGTDQNRIRGTK